MRRPPSEKTLERRRLDAVRVRVFAIETLADCAAFETDALSGGLLAGLNEQSLDDVRSHYFCVRCAISAEYETIELLRLTIAA